LVPFIILLHSFYTQNNFFLVFPNILSMSSDLGREA